MAGFTSVCWSPGNFFSQTQSPWGAERVRSEHPWDQPHSGDTEGHRWGDTLLVLLPQHTTLLEATGESPSVHPKATPPALLFAPAGDMGNGEGRQDGMGRECKFWGETVGFLFSAYLHGGDKALLVKQKEEEGEVAVGLQVFGSLQERAGGSCQSWPQSCQSSSRDVGWWVPKGERVTPPPQQ